MRKSIISLLSGNGFFGIGENLSILYLLSFMSNYSNGITKERKNYAYYKTKTFYQNSRFKEFGFYYNKTMPRNRFSQISKEGARIRYKNLQVKLFKERDKQIKERNLKIALGQN